jgi:hypothetical protein
MAIKEYKLQSSSIPYNEIRIFVLDSVADAPETQSIRDNDIFFIVDQKSVSFGSSGALTAFEVDDYSNWEDDQNSFNDTPTLRAAVEQLAGRVQALEDIL